jgi:hypothetical protein
MVLAKSCSAIISTTEVTEPPSAGWAQTFTAVRSTSLAVSFLTLHVTLSCHKTEHFQRPSATDSVANAPLAMEEYAPGTLEMEGRFRKRGTPHFPLRGPLLW